MSASASGRTIIHRDPAGSQIVHASSASGSETYSKLIVYPSFADRTIDPRGRPRARVAISHNTSLPRNQVWALVAPLKTAIEHRSTSQLTALRDSYQSFGWNLTIAGDKKTYRSLRGTNSVELTPNYDLPSPYLILMTRFTELRPDALLQRVDTHPIVILPTHMDIRQSNEMTQKIDEFSTERDLYLPGSQDVHGRYSYTPQSDLRRKISGLAVTMMLPTHWTLDDQARLEGSVTRGDLKSANELMASVGEVTMDWLSSRDGPLAGITIDHWTDLQPVKDLIAFRYVLGRFE